MVPLKASKFSREPSLPLSPIAFRMEELQQHRSSQKGYRAHLTKLTTSANQLMATITEDLPEENVKTAAALDSLLGQLNWKEKLLSDLDAKILHLISDESDLETEVFEAEEIQSKIVETVSNIKSFTKRLLHKGNEVPQSECPKSKIPDPAVVTLSESPLTANLDATHNSERNDHEPLRTDDNPLTNRGQVATRLPKLTIPMFGGDPLDWQSFWDSFESVIHSNTQLNGPQKLSYLHAQLHGDAAQAIAGLSLTSNILLKFLGNVLAKITYL